MNGGLPPISFEYKWNPVSFCRPAVERKYTKYSMLLLTWNQNRKWGSQNILFIRKLGVLLNTPRPDIDGGLQSILTGMEKLPDIY